MLRDDLCEEEMDLSKLVDFKILIDLGHFSTSTQMNHTSLSKK